MAEKLKANGDGSTPDKPTSTHNAKSRNEAIADALEKLFIEDSHIERELEQHVTPHRDEKKKIKERIRKDYEVSTTLLNARYSLYRRQRVAAKNNDDTTLDVLRELFAIAPIGEQLDLVTTIQEADTRAGA